MTVLEIRKDAIWHNIDIVKARAGVPVWGVLKYDGYGLGLRELAKLLRQAGIDRFAVSGAEELHMLRQAGFQTEDILLLSPQATETEMQAALRLGAIFSVGSPGYARVLADCAKAMHTTPRVHVAVDTGMGRFGFLPPDYEAIRTLYRQGEWRVEGIYSHFADACADPGKTRRQLAQFRTLLDRLVSDGIERGMAHIANSPGLFLCEGAALDAVRIGSAFTGRVSGLRESPLRQAAILHTAVCEVKTLPKGSRVGYGGEQKLRRETTLAVLSAGRRHGVPCIPRFDRLRRKFPCAEIGGAQVPLISTRGENHAIADVTGLTLSPGEKVTIEVNPLRVDSGVRRVYR